MERVSPPPSREFIVVRVGEVVVNDGVDGEGDYPHHQHHRQNESGDLNHSQPLERVV